jgi:hypothetical protein
MRDASDSRDWITVKRSKNKKKVGALHEISSSNRVLNISSSNSKKAVMHHEVAPKVQPSSLPKSTNHSVSFKCNDKNVKKCSSFAKKPKNSLDKSFKAFAEDLKKLIKTHDLLQFGLTKADQQMPKVKKELTDNTDLLLLHNGLVKHLQQLQIDRLPVILKTKNVNQLQRKYEVFLNSVDVLRDTVGK